MAINFPNSPSNGATHTAAGQTFTYDSTAGVWNPQEGTPVSTGTSAPSSPSPGDLWFDTAAGTLYFYYADGSTNQWVGVTGPSGPTGATGATGPAGPSGSINILTDVDTATAAPSAGDLLKWNGTNWVPTPSVGITHIDTWRLSSNVTSDTLPITTWSHTATSADFQANLGSAMTVSSGYWTFPTTGYWKVEFIARIDLNGNDNLNIGIIGALYSGGSLSSTTTLAGQTTGDNVGMIHTGYVFTHVNVTNTSNIKVGLYANNIASGNYIQASSSTVDYTYVTFTRLGDSQ